MLKRTILTLAALTALAFTFAACGDSDDNSNPPATTQVTQPETNAETPEPDTYAEPTPIYEDVDNDENDDYEVSEEDSIRGSWSGNVYTSQYLGITFTAPATWEISTDDELAMLFGLTSDVLGLNALQMVGIFADMMAMDSETGNNVQVIFENLWDSITEEEYIAEMIPQFEEFGGEIDVIPGTVSLGNRNWHSYNTTLDLGFGSIQGRQLLSIQDDTAVMIIITYFDDYVNEILDMFGSL